MSMERGRTEEIQRLFHAALERPEEERQAFLEEATEGNLEVCALVNDLIRASSEAEGFLTDEGPVSPETMEVSSGLPLEWGSSLVAAPQAGIVLGDYEILEKLGGNMGLVFKARHRLLDKVVALKVLPADSMADSTRRARFERELRIMGQLEHPNLVAAFDARIEGRWHLLAMELIEGLDLERLVEGHGPLPVAAACEVARQAALGLEYARERGLVHRDVKPSNLMLTPAGTVRVIDVGLALIKDESEACLTQPGLLMGTFAYSAPEQFRDASNVDIRADIYSLGCTLHHLLTGSPPYGSKASLREMIHAHTSEPLPPLLEARPDAPAGLEDVLREMTAKDPARRFASPMEVAEALLPFTAGADLQSLFARTGHGTARRLPEKKARRGAPARDRRLLFAAAAVAAALVAFWVGGKLGLGPGPSSTGELQVTSLQVEHIQNQAGKAVRRGRIGSQSSGAEVDDDVLVFLTLSEPGYFYLLALNPDGSVQLCWPADEEIAPAKTSDLSFPAGGDGFGLTDGEGLQGFLLAASRDPLPAYARWREAGAALPWAKTDAEGVWRFAGAKLELEGEDSRVRGEVRKLRGPEPFSKVCESLSARPEFDSVRAIAFPVRARK